MHILQELVREGKILAHDIARYLHIAELQARLARLRAENGQVPVPHVETKKAAKTKRRAKKAVSAEVAATRRVQGQYIAHLTKFPKTARWKFQKIAREDSREKAIAAMKKALAK